jgi:hypothetical protein
MAMADREAFDQTRVEPVAERKPWAAPRVILSECGGGTEGGATPLWSDNHYGGPSTGS